MSAGVKGGPKTVYLQPHTRMQLEHLMTMLGKSGASVIRVAIDRLYRETARDVQSPEVACLKPSSSA